MDCRWWWWWLCLCCQNKHFVDFLWTIIHPLYRANCDGEIIWLNWMCVPGNWKRDASGSKLEMEWDLMSKQSGGWRWWICERVVEWSWKGVEIYVFSVKTVRVTLPQYPSCCWMLSGRNWRRVIPCDCVIKHNLIRSLCARCVGLYEGFVGFNLGPFLRDKALIKSHSGQVKRKCRNKTIFQKRFFDNNAIRRRWGRVGWSLITISWLVLWCMSWVEGG